MAKDNAVKIGVVWLGKLAYEDVGRHFTHLATGIMNGGEVGLDDGGNWLIVETGDRNLAWNGDSRLLELAYTNNRGGIVAAENAVGQPIHFEHGLHCIYADRFLKCIDKDKFRFVSAAV